MALTRKQFKVSGMHCRSCEMLIKDALEEDSGVSKVIVSHEAGTVSVEFDDSRLSEGSIRKIIANEGYGVE